MALDTSDVLDLSKENIQPLRHGRKAAQLKTALQAQSDPEIYQTLLRQREIYEYQIRMYEGDDPFEPYYKYVLWLEQSFPSGCEKNLFSLIEDTLLRFKDCDQYKQDPRLVQLLIKYINFQPNPLELYQLVYNQGLGTMCSALYKAWAEELDKSNDFRKADEILKLGLRCRAQPLNELEEFHIQFQLSVARRFLDGHIDDFSSSSEPTRTVLSKLKPSKVKTNRISKETPGVLISDANKPISKSQNNGVAKFEVYQEEMSDERPHSEFKNDNENFPRGSVTNRENTLAASKWRGQKLKQSTYKISVAPATPSFEIHEDQDAVCNNLKTTIRPAALRSRKAEFKCPVAVFEPPDPRNKPMYPKHLVYVGGRDVQLEEIRAAYYWKNIEKMEQENKHRENIMFEERRKNIGDGNTGTSNQYVMSRSTVPKEKSPELFTAPVLNHIQTVSEKSCIKNSVNFEGSSSSLSVQTKQQISETTTHSEKGKSHCETTTSDLPANVKYENKIINPQVYEDKDSVVTRNSSFAPNNRLKASITASDVFVDKEVWSRQHLTVQKHQSKKLVEHTKTVENDAFLNENAIPQHHSFPKTSAKSADFLKPSMTSAKPILKEDSFDDSVFPKQRQGFDHGFSDNLGALNKHQVKKEETVGFGAFDFPSTSPYHYSPSTSMTVNTKAAMNVIQQMWESPLSQQRAEENLPVMSNKYAFSRYCDDSSPKKPDKECVKSRNIATEATSCAPFPIYCEDSIVQEEMNKVKNKDPPKVSKTDNPSRQLTCRKLNKYCGSAASSLPLIVPVNLQNTPLELDDKENIPVNTLRTSTRRTPPISIDVFVDSDKEDELYAKDRDMDDETCDTRAFAIKLPSSTPSSEAEKFKQARKLLTYNRSELCDDTFSYEKTNQKPLESRTSLDCSKKVNKNIPDLSLILENSKEQGSNSSGSTGGNAVSKFCSS